MQKKKLIIIIKTARSNYTGPIIHEWSTAIDQSESRIGTNRFIIFVNVDS